MMSAIASAQLGDDVFQEDPTINELETLAADTMGKEAALLVPSGTMANLISVLSHCERGSEVILGDQAHSFMYEAGGISAFGGIHSRQVSNQRDGTLKLEDVESAIRQDNVHFPPTRLICLENTHNRCFGMPLTVEYTKSVVQLAGDHGISVHVDGARIFNAAASLKVNPRELTESVNSVSFCLSKGLSAPVGSMVCGSAEFIAQARRNRKALGGGMRQAGIIAAAGIRALETMVDRISDDHRNAKKLADGIAEIDGLGINLDTVKTNIVYFSLNRHDIAGEVLVNRMSELGIHFFELSPHTYRLVTHTDVDENDMDAVLKAFRKVMEDL
ncbi:uncharacterized protein METZ01_LOCUS157325 [marine metagenome]|uniref:Aromatic amino acid beta-eliminating lyase/threonine aldolase domain-containing protein n=1 Tax=marine metagenome TaxID=408172 RepID=A0A382AT49_9ZZZZ